MVVKRETSFSSFGRLQFLYERTEVKNNTKSINIEKSGKLYQQLK